MTALYEIAENHRELAELVDSGEMTMEQVADTMEMIEGEFSDKAQSLVAIKENMEGDVIAIDSAIKRLTERKKVIQNRQASMIEYLRTNMESSGITKIKCPYFEITLAKGRDVVRVDNPSLISSEYIETKVISTPVKKDILAALKAGEKVEGCSLVKSKSSVRIK